MRSSILSLITLITPPVVGCATTSTPSPVAPATIAASAEQTAPMTLPDTSTKVAPSFQNARPFTWEPPPWQVEDDKALLYVEEVRHQSVGPDSHEAFWGIMAFLEPKDMSWTITDVYTSQPGVTASKSKLDGNRPDRPSLAYSIDIHAPVRCTVENKVILSVEMLPGPGQEPITSHYEIDDFCARAVSVKRPVPLALPPNSLTTDTP